MPSIPVNPVPVSTSGDGVNSMDTTSSNSAPLVVEFSSPFYLHHGESP
jgi:hypothetical protein